ncbi:MAG: protein translocase subunit SecD [Oscillospiraceae bacterium]|jgi:preprotein translocase subunit SecD|nr:protein translocase subunit SecD [Oscillospiraceae bacterium]
MAKKKLSHRKRNNVVTIILTVVLIAVFSYLALAGFGRGFMVRYMRPWGEAISLGLDLRGGVYTVYQAVNNGEGNFDSMLDGTIGVLAGRLTGQGFTEATVTRQGTDRIRIEIPDVKDPDEILNIIGTPAHLEFKDEAGTVLMEGKHVRTATAATGGQNNTPVVFFTLTDEGKQIFAEATRNNIGKTISIELDGRVISAPRVDTVIASGSGYIEGEESLEAAKNLAMLIQSGALPLDIKQLEVSAISATLGVEALNKALLAGEIGLALVMLFMLVRYRLPGLVADLTLAIYILLVVFLVAVTGTQLTLPGVAGIVLGIGMAVDANVIIFERFREEARRGKPLVQAVKGGFANALSAIIDSNITTIIAALVLLIFGTGSVKGFATTLIIGVLTSMFTAVVVSRTLLEAFVNLGIAKPKLYVG